MTPRRCLDRHVYGPRLNTCLVLALDGFNPEDVPRYLQDRGFDVGDALKWTAPADASSPAVRIDVVCHSEVNGHTWYQLRCDISTPDKVHALTWSTQRRLEQLRTQLHDPLKADLGENYSEFFRGARFAHRGGLPGTSNRLAAWCGSLARHISCRRVSPAVAALTLRFLGAPGVGSPRTPVAMKSPKSRPAFGGVSSPTESTADSSGEELEMAKELSDITVTVRRAGSGRASPSRRRQPGPRSGSDSDPQCASEDSDTDGESTDPRDGEVHGEGSGQD